MAALTRVPLRRQSARCGLVQTAFREPCAGVGQQADPQQIYMGHPPVVPISWAFGELSRFLSHIREGREAIFSLSIFSLAKTPSGCLAAQNHIDSKRVANSRGWGGSAPMPICTLRFGTNRAPETGRSRERQSEWISIWLPVDCVSVTGKFNLKLFRGSGVRMRTQKFRSEFQACW
jgi:hypothetical protein